MLDFKIYLEKDKILNPTEKGFLSEYFRQGCPATYDVDGKLQCGRNRGRSFNDLYALMKGRFENASKKKLAKNLLQLGRTNKVRIMNCITINKMVIHSSKIHGDYWSFLLDGKEQHLNHIKSNLDRGELNFNDLKRIAEYGE